MLASATPVHALNVDDARHLLTRSGFGAAPHEIARLLPLSRESAVDALLDGLHTSEHSPRPAFLAQPMNDYLQRLGDYAPPEMLAGTAAGSAAQPAMTGEDKQPLTHRGMQEMAQLRIWWLDQMISTPSPLGERLALFWHNHFTSKYFDVLTPRLMHEQLQLVRHAGTRNFGELLAAMLRDPAMLIFLDNALNTREAPNENFARELLELFTLGIGHYQEQDIKALARMLAGHSVDFGGSWGYLPRPAAMDTGEKAFLGQRGRFTIDDALRILLAHPRTAEFISEKFYREFVAPQPDAAEIRRLAAVLRGHRYSMRPFLRALLLSPQFWSTTNRGQLVKSPVELLVGFVRSFGVWMPDVEMLDSYAALLGQQLFEPPSVEGWKGGMHWLNAQSIALRSTVVERLWTAHASGLDYLAAGPQDLLLRYSAETREGQAARIALKVNGQAMYQGQARAAADTSAEGRSGPKPAWELVRVPRARLPLDVRQVEVVFEPAGSAAHLFVNWLQLDGQRLPSWLATASFGGQSSCAADGGNIPVGMLYCPATLRFELRPQRSALARSAADRRLATLDDIAHGPVNSIIEYGTARLPLALRPAARKRPGPKTVSALRRAAAQEWAALPKRDEAAAVLAADPLQALPAGQHDAPARLRAMTLDPAFNLK